jgi:hypothetical protein
MISLNEIKQQLLEVDPDILAADMHRAALMAARFYELHEQLTKLPCTYLRPGLVWGAGSVKSETGRQEAERVLANLSKYRKP